MTLYDLQIPNRHWSASSEKNGKKKYINEIKNWEEPKEKRIDKFDKTKSKRND